jgi:O-succinylbenzoic acid--CoA ligase
MFISGGENIYPEEIECALKSIPPVLEAVVVPVPHPEYGWCPVAYIGHQSDMEISISQLVAELKAKLPSFKIPQAFYHWPNHMPCPLDGKIDRRRWLDLNRQALSGNGDSVTMKR